MCFIAVVIFGEMAWYQYDQDHHLGASSMVADAQVVKVQGNGRYGSYVIVEFTAAGRQVRARVEDYSWQPKPQPGNDVQVRYDPADPEDYVRDERMLNRF